MEGSGGREQPSGDERLAAIERYLVHSQPDPSLDRVSRLAARAFRVPMAAVSFVGEDRVRYVGRYGFEVTEVETLPGLCATAVARPGSYVLGDALADPRAREHPLVSGPPQVRFYAAVPIVVAGSHSIGTVCVMDTVPGRARADQLAMLHDLGFLVADTLEWRATAAGLMEAEQEARSRLVAETERVGQLAETLQASLTPLAPPRVPGLGVAAFCRPLSRDAVGGDFYDVFPIGEGRWGIFVGDVAGKGVEAAAFTSLARYSLRAAALVQPGPGEVLAAVNEAMLRDPAAGESLYCTIAYGEFAESDDGWLAVVAIGGHPPPLVIRADGHVEEVNAEGTIIGSFEDQHYTTVQVALGPGDTIVLYSDGMSELPTGKGRLGVEGVARALEQRHVASADDAISLLREIIADNDQPLGDDVVIVAVTVPGGPGSREPGGDRTGAQRRAVLEAG
ncbi:MAG: PP2C family protein-serine/threonine phosphatase [Actinomycetota bacterium]